MPGRCAPAARGRHGENGIVSPEVPGTMRWEGGVGDMQTKYIVPLVLVAVGFVAVPALVFWSPVGEGSRIGNAIQGAGVFAALFAAIVALAGSDPKPKYVRLTAEIEVASQEPARYLKARLSPELQQLFATFPDPVMSHQVGFRLRNASGFTLRRPTITFWLPRKRGHPDDEGKRVDFHSNTFNSTKDLSQLSFEDTVVISNINLPYLNADQSILIWIRMCLDDVGRTPFPVHVSRNCENAEGANEKVMIDPGSCLPPLSGSIAHVPGRGEDMRPGAVG